MILACEPELGRGTRTRREVRLTRAVPPSPGAGRFGPARQPMYAGDTAAVLMRRGAPVPSDGTV
ncbi:hypothetical protein GCM10023335_15210 [Streptomyces siamensis]|uniref:Uncharacterized protein n=1 Tax=Streptomyces siamensis TaxID=1274986 RepID=A0ABP9IM10_9ACTN